MLTLRGAPALSEFRLARLLARCREREPSVATVYAEFVHFLDVASALSASERALVDNLLEYGPRLRPARAPGELRLVLPRSGHAVAVVLEGHRHRAQLRPRGVRRIERGVAYQARDASGAALGPEPARVRSSPCCTTG